MYAHLSTSTGASVCVRTGIFVRAIARGRGCLCANDASIVLYNVWIRLAPEHTFLVEWCR